MVSRNTKKIISLGVIVSFLTLYIMSSVCFMNFKSLDYKGPSLSCNSQAADTACGSVTPAPDCFTTHLQFLHGFLNFTLEKFLITLFVLALVIVAGFWLLKWLADRYYLSQIGFGFAQKIINFFGFLTARFLSWLVILEKRDPLNYAFAYQAVS